MLVPLIFSACHRAFRIVTPKAVTAEGARAGERHGGAKSEDHVHVPARACGRLSLAPGQNRKRLGAVSPQTYTRGEFTSTGAFLNQVPRLFRMIPSETEKDLVSSLKRARRYVGKGSAAFP